MGKTEFDAIVVGSGPAGATIARDLSKRGRRVLVLERGEETPLKEGFRMASILNSVQVGEQLSTVSAYTTGGTTAVYFASAVEPPIDNFKALGVDIAREAEEAKSELPLSQLPDNRLSAATLRARECAAELGYGWEKASMMVDQSACRSGYCYHAKWNARRFLGDAINAGASLVTRAKVRRVLVERKRALGVEYETRAGKKHVEIRRAYGAKVILSAGAAASPIILKDSGIRSVLQCGFYCHPSYAYFGTVRGLKARDGFVGSMGTVFDGNIAIGDGNASRTLFRLMMLANRQFIRAFRYSSAIGVGVMVREGLAGGLSEDGKYHKELNRQDRLKLEKGGDVALRIVQRAGGTDIYKSPLSSSQIGGTIRLNEHIDTNFETEYRNLHVCDGSIIPHDVNITPTLTLICLGKYLAKTLAARA